jgi:peptidyl-prolyl cis-trans isomerase C
MFVVISLLFFTLTTQANDLSNESGILAERGNGVVTQSAFAARADKIPADARKAVLRNRNRVRDLINTTLLRSQLAYDAREAGFDKEQLVMDRMQLAAEAELAEAWAQHYVQMQPKADYEALAHEYYLLHQEETLSSPKIDVSHILISNKTRTDEEAQALADTVSSQLKENPGLFDELVLTYSEDPSAQSNKGKFTGVKKGDMVKPFEVTAFALEVGAISEPVRTEYGYHIIRLDAKIAPEKLSFDQVKTQLIETERKAHEERIIQDYILSLTSLEVKMTQEALEEMVRAQFGEDYVDTQDDAQNQE